MKTSTTEKLYIYAQLDDCGKDLTKDWFVYFSYRNPETGKMKRFKIYNGLGKAKTVEERTCIGRSLAQKTNRQLRNGYNPFENSKYVYKPITPVEPAKTVTAISIQEHLTNIIKEESASIRKATVHAYQSQVKGLCKWLKKSNLTALAVQDFSLEHAGKFLNHIGLSSGLACTLVIYLWVNDELHVDKFHKKDSQLFQVMEHFEQAHGIWTSAATPGPLAESLVAEMPEVEYNEII